MTHYAGAGVVPQYARDTPVCFFATVADDHEARVLRIAHADATAVVDGYPGRPARRIQQRIQQRPVGYRIGTVSHRFGFAIRACHRAAVEMVAADDHRCLQFTVAHHLVEREAKPVALTEAYPADACRKSLEVNPLGSSIQPLVEMLVVRDQLLDLRVGAVDVLGVTRQRCPAERADAAAEQRAHVRGDESREVEGIIDTLVQRYLADVVAVVERGHAGFVKREHGAHVHGHRFDGRIDHRIGVRLAALEPFLDGPADRQVAVGRIVRRGLVGHGVGPDAALYQLRQDFGRIAQQTDRQRLPVVHGLLDQRQRIVQVVGLRIEIACFEALLDAIGLAFDRQHRGPGHRCRQRLCAAHAAEPGRQYPAPGQVAAIVLAAHFDEGLVGTLHDALAADIDPRPCRHLAEHHQSLPVELAEVFPVGPGRHQVRVGNQNARRIGMRAEYADRLAGLHQQGFLVAEFPEAFDDSVEALPVAGSLADAAIHDQVLRSLGDIGVEIVHDHA